MRLYEITNTLTPDKFTTTSTSSDADPKFAYDDDEYVGGGLFSHAFSTKQEPGTVRKVAKTMSEAEFLRDAYFKYVKMLAKNDRFISNPYFPKIYDIQIKKIPLKPDDPNTLYDYVWAMDMERLHEFNDISNNEAFMLGNRIFYDYKSITKELLKDNRTYNEKQLLVAHLYNLITIFKPVTYSTSIKDPLFKKAILLIRALKIKNKSMFYDIHSGNIMIRRTPAGPQLVITDPLGHS